ncbi:MAG TPA: hypothetical protein VFJ10_01820 [Acidobacteriaceae bacterium]|nr:hypothetical protein [Acidobacteriaceae bacterium]
MATILEPATIAADALAERNAVQSNGALYRRLYSQPLRRASHIEAGAVFVCRGWIIRD